LKIQEAMAEEQNKDQHKNASQKQGAWSWSKTGLKGETLMPVDLVFVDILRALPQPNC
jgi:hypothetical protein